MQLPTHAICFTIHTGHHSQFLLGTRSQLVLMDMYVIFIILQKAKQVLPMKKKKKNKLTANMKCGRVSKVHAHLSNLFLIGIHWRIFLEEILMCGVINWNKWKNLPYIQTKFASTAADSQALNVSQLVEKFYMAAALNGPPVRKLHFQPQPGREGALVLFVHFTQK